MDFYRCETTIQAGLKAQVGRPRENAVVFVLSEHCVSSWFSMLVEGWGLHRPPSLRVFHRGESSDIPAIQGGCRLCLWRRWNTVLCFTAGRSMEKAVVNWVWWCNCCKINSFDPSGKINIRRIYCPIYLWWKTLLIRVTVAMMNVFLCPVGSLFVMAKNAF